MRSATSFRAAIGVALASVLIAAFGAITACQDARIVALRAPGVATPDASIERPTGGDAANDGSVSEVPVNVVCPPSALPGFPPVGFAAWTGTSTAPTLPTTGGEGGAIVTAATLDDLATYAAMAVPLVIQIGTTISLTGQSANMVPVQSNKTIRGIAPGAGLNGVGLWLYNAENIIVQNLTIFPPLKPNDAITVQHAKRVLIDHCDLSSVYDVPSETYDGLVDITHASDNVTVSWTHFHDHQDTCLVGHSNAPDAMLEDTNHLTVTYHHNWFTHILGHSPRVRFGSVHVFNNLYQDIPSTAVISQMGAAVLVEGNVFRNVGTPMTTLYLDPMEGTVNGNYMTTNAFAMSGLSTITMANSWVPPYAGMYHLDATEVVPLLVQTCAGPKF